jgi:hypothetical protein
MMEYSNSRRFGFTAIIYAIVFGFMLFGGARIALPNSGFWLAFDGVDDRVRVADSASLDIVQHITLEAWFRAESIPGSGGQARVVSKSFNYELSVHSADGGCVAGTAGDVQWRAIIGGADRRICGGAIAPGTWHHVAGTYNGSQFVLYLDGNLVAATARSGSIGTNNEDLLIGNNPVLNRPFKGDIDEVRVWRVARTQQQIIDDMDRELSGTEAGLVAYYRLNEGSGQYVFDETDYGNDGVLGSTAGVDADDPAWRPIGGGVNAAPQVDAGADQTIVWPADTVTLAGTVSDDGLPAGVLDLLWSKVSGPGTVIFGDEFAQSTSATFSGTGVYVLRLTADDTLLSASDDVTVTVAEGGAVNAAPQVDAGADQTIVWPADTVTLAGTVSDDGLPAGVLDLLWSKVSGPGTVIFGDAFAQSTSATFSGTGVYVLRLTADDTLLSASDDVTVTVAEGGAVNAAPQVDAGADQTIVWPADTVTLAGTVSDDGLPAGVLDLLWSKVSGPGTVTFGDAFAQSTSATFSGTGVYVLRLTADDTLLSASDDVTVTVGSGAVTYPGDIWLAFDGVDDRVRVADSASLDIVQHITLEAWFRAESIPGSGGQARVVSKSFNYELSVHSADGGCVAGTAGDVQWRAIIGGADRRICGGAIAPGTWHHVAGTYNGSQFVLYLDGNLVAGTARSGSIGTNNEDLLIGNNPVLNRPFKGDIDEVRVWRVARTQQQIIDDMDRELSGTEAGLVAYYRLNEGSGQYVFDETDYGNDGVLGSTAGVDADDPAWRPIGGGVNAAPQVDGCGPDDRVAGGRPAPATTGCRRGAGPALEQGQRPGHGDLREFAQTRARRHRVLRLTADDTLLSASDDVTVTVPRTRRRRSTRVRTRRSCGRRTR